MTIIDENVYLQLYARAPAPCRDYYGLTVSSDLVILNIWNISHGPHVYPKRQKTPLNEFSEDKHLQNEVRRLFGVHVLNFANDLAAKKRNLQFLPARVFLRILRLLAANDILRLSQTSKIFFELCNTETAWKLIFRKRVKESVLPQDTERAESVGWKQTAKENLHLMMHAGKSISSKKQTPTINKTGAKSQSIANNKNAKSFNSKAPKKLAANPKTTELNNKAHSAHLSTKKQVVNLIKNVDKEVIKSGDAKKVNVNKNVPVHNPEKLNTQAKRPSVNRAVKTLSKSPGETGDNLKNNVLKNNLQKKVGSKGAQSSKEFAKF